MCAARCRLCCERLKAELASSRQACCNAARDFGTRQIPNLNEVQLPTPTFFHVFQPEVERHAKLGRPSVPGQGTLKPFLGGPWDINDSDDSLHDFHPDVHLLRVLQFSSFPSSSSLTFKQSTLR